MFVVVGVWFLVGLCWFWFVVSLWFAACACAFPWCVDVVYLFVLFAYLLL